MRRKMKTAEKRNLLPEIETGEDEIIAKKQRRKRKVSKLS